MPMTNPCHRRLPCLALMFVSALCAAQQTGTSTTDSREAFPWGEVAGGLQLRVGTGVNTEKLTETRSLLFLDITVRNVSGQPATVFMAYPDATYNFEYEIDGTWYAFEPMVPVRTPLTAIRETYDIESERTVAPGAEKGIILTVPLAARSPGLQLHAITAEGTRVRFEPKPGPHVIRVRPGPEAIGDRPAPVSNAVTISFRTPASIDIRSQSTSFVAARDTPLRELRLARGPEEDRALILSILERPPSPSRAPLLITADAVQVWDPIPYYSLRLPRRRDEPAPGMPEPSSRRIYPVLAAGQFADLLEVESSPAGLVFDAFGNLAGDSAEVFSALQQLAGMQQVRGAAYEPRIVQLMGTRALPSLRVLWLHSSSDRSDIFYWPRPPRFSGWTKVESDRIYSWDEFLKAAQALPATPQHDEAWAIAAALACTQAQPELYRGPYLPERAEVEIGLSDERDRIVWYVFIPSPMPPGRVMNPAPGATLFVDETGSCKP